MFQFQSRLIQTEGFIAQVAQTQFDAQMDMFYYNLGRDFHKSVQKGTGNSSARAALNYANFLNSPACANLRDNWALNGLASLIYGKADNRGLPLAWSAPDTDVKEYVSILKPYLASVDMKAHVGLIHQIVAQAGIDVPKAWVDAITESNGKQGMLKSYLAMLFLLENALLVYDRPLYSSTDKTQVIGYEPCFITRSRKLLYSMAMSGSFSLSSDPNTAISEGNKMMAKFDSAIVGASDKLWGTKMKTALSAGLFAVAKLTPKSVDGNGRCCYDLTIPQTPLNLCDANARVLPVNLMYQFCEGLMYHMVENSISRITCVTPARGEFSTIATITPGTFKQLYADCTDSERVEQRSRLPVGFALRSGKLQVLNLESSLHSAHGYSHIDPWSITNIQKIAPKDVNCAAHNFDPNAIRAVFTRHLKNMQPAELRSLLTQIPELASVYKEPSLTITGVTNAVSNVHYTVLLSYLLKTIPNVQEELSHVGERPPMRDYVLKGNTDLERIESLKKLMSEHIVYISYTSSKGPSEVYTTSNEKLLASKLGDWYKLKYEAWAVRVEALKQYIAETKLNKVSAIEALVNKYKIKDLDCSKLTDTTPEAIDKWIEEAKTNRKTRNITPDPLNICVRDVNATAPNEYFKTIKYNSIQAIKIEDEEN